MGRTHLTGLRGARAGIGGALYLNPGFVHRRELGNLLFENSRGLFLLCFDEAAAHHTVEFREVAGNVTAAIHVESSLELSNHQESVIDMAGAGFDLAVVQCERGAAEVFDGLFVKTEDEAHWACAPCCGLAIVSFCVHGFRAPK